MYSDVSLINVPGAVEPALQPLQAGGNVLPKHLSTAIVHDWLPVYAGAERVLEQMINVIPQSEIYSLIDFLPDDQRAFLQGKSVNTSFIQRLPFARSKYRNYLPFVPFATEQFGLFAAGYSFQLHPLALTFGRLKLFQ